MSESKPAPKPKAAVREYEPSFAIEAARIAAAIPVTDKGWALYFGVRRGHIRQWRMEHPEFERACRLTEATATPGIIDTLLQAAIDGAPWAITLFLERRVPGWAKTQTIDVNMTNRPAEELTDAELERIARSGAAQPIRADEF